MANNADESQLPVQIMTTVTPPNSDLSQSPVQIMAHDTPNGFISQNPVQVLIARPSQLRIYISS